MFISFSALFYENKHWKDYMEMIFKDIGYFRNSWSSICLMHLINKHKSFRQPAFLFPTWVPIVDINHHSSYFLTTEHLELQCHQFVLYSGTWLTAHVRVIKWTTLLELSLLSVRMKPCHGQKKAYLNSWTICIFSKE